MDVSEHQPGDLAPVAGAYEELNIFGSPTGSAAILQQGERIPLSPRGFTWRLLSDLPQDVLRARAAAYRGQADAAATAGAAARLRALAERFDALADQQPPVPPEPRPGVAGDAG